MFSTTCVALQVSDSNGLVEKSKAVVDAEYSSKGPIASQESAMTAKHKALRRISYAEVASKQALQNIATNELTSSKPTISAQMGKSKIHSK